jgi:hypothetical protein
VPASNVIVGYHHLAAVDADADREPDRIKGWDEGKPAATALSALSKMTRNESPPVSISRPPNRRASSSRLSVPGESRRAAPAASVS